MTHRAATLLTLLLAAPATAQIIPTGSPAADILLAQAIAEQRVFLTCSALDPATHALVLDYWNGAMRDAFQIMTERKVPPEATSAFLKAANPAALMPAPDTPWEDVKQLCDSHPTWFQDLQEFKLTNLKAMLPQALPSP